MTKDKLKDDIIRTICFLNSDISNKDRELLIKLFNSIIDYTNNTELEQKHNELVDTVDKLKAKVETYFNKINELEKRVHQLENASRS